MPSEFSHSSATINIRFIRSGTESVLVILDSGQAQAEHVWAEVIRGVEAAAPVLLIDGLVNSPAETRDAFADKMQQFHRHDTIYSQNAHVPAVFAGWRDGAARIQHLAVSTVLHPLALILIDPEPLGVDSITQFPSETADFSGSPHNLNHGQLQTLSEIPVTVILPGTRPDQNDQDAIERASLQREDLKRFSNYREVIAGRSRSRIPEERPDVIIDTIAYYLGLPR